MFAMTPVVVTTSVTAEVSLHETEGGIKVIMHCSYLPNSGHTKPYTFRLFALGTDGTAEQLSSWTAGSGDDRLISGTSRYRLIELVRLELRSSNGTTLLVYDLS